MEMLTIGLILGIAVIDSINPSALLATGYILKNAPDERKSTGVGSYVAGIFCFYLVIGILLLFGLSFASQALGAFFESKPAYFIQAVLGIFLFIWSWIPPKPPQQSRLHPKIFTARALFLLGITITFVEFITAVPYLGAITLLQNTDTSLAVKISLLVAYNIIFVLPPIIMLLAYRFNRERFTRWQTQRAAKRGDTPDTTLQWIAGIIGVLLFLNALSGLGFQGVNISL